MLSQQENGTEPSIKDVLNAITLNAKNVALQLNTIQASVSSLKEEIENKQSACEKELASHKNQIIFFTKREARKNLIIYGWSEIVNFPLQAIREKLLELFEKKLEIKNVRSFDIHNIRVAGNKKNIIIASLCSPELVRLAVTNARKLAGTKIYLRFDSSPEEREIRKKLLEHRRILTASGKDCKIKKNELIVDSVPHSLSQLECLTNTSKQGGNKYVQSKRGLSSSPESPLDSKKKQKVTTPGNDKDSYHTDDDEFTSPKNWERSMTQDQT